MFCNKQPKNPDLHITCLFVCRMHSFSNAEAKMQHFVFILSQDPEMWLLQPEFVQTNKPTNKQTEWLLPWRSWNQSFFLATTVWVILRQPRLPSIQQEREHSELHNLSSHSGSCYVNFVRLPPLNNRHTTLWGFCRVQDLVWTQPQ